MTVSAQLADGRTLEFPDGTDPKVIQETVKRTVGTTVAPPQSPPPQSGFRLGPNASQAVRPLANAVAGAPLLLGDALAGIVNLVPESILGPKMEPPSQQFQRGLDQLTTPPQGTVQKWGETINSMLAGGLTGPKAPRISNVSPEVRSLAQRGVVTTPGQRAGVGSWTNEAEQRASSLPFGGHAITKARGTAVEQWNRAALDQALKDAGGTAIPATRKTARDQLFHVKQELTRRYGEVLGKMKGDLNGQLRTALDSLKTMAGNLSVGAASTIRRIIDHEVIGKFTHAGKASGETLKEVQDTLRTEADAYRTGGVEERKIAGALDQARAELLSMLKRENPKLAPELEGVDKGYAQFQTAARASRYGKKSGGIYTPAQKLRAIEARDTSKNKIRFATGQAAGQKEAETAERVLGNNVPDSGTPGRLELIQALRNPHQGVAGLAAGGVTPLIYNQAVLKWLQDRALSNSPELLSKLGIVGGANQSTAEQ